MRTNWQLNDTARHRNDAHRYADRSGYDDTPKMAPLTFNASKVPVIRTPIMVSKERRQ